MAIAGLTTVKFAARADVLQKTTMVYLTLNFGKVRANYISGTENYQDAYPDAYWSYQFSILDEDIPSGYCLADVVGANFIAPYIEPIGEYDECPLCRPASSIEIDNLAEIVQVFSQQSGENGTELCDARMDIGDFALALTPLLDLQWLIDNVCPACECTPPV